MQFKKNNDKFQSNVKDIRIQLPINLFTFNPCKEYIIQKAKIMGRYEELALITNELDNLGLPIDNIGLLSKIDSLSKSHPPAKVVQLVQRWYEQRQSKSKT